MNILARSSRPIPILFKSVALALVGATTLSFSTPAAFAGASELKALQAALPVPIAQATSQQLYDAFKVVIADAKFNTVKKYGIVAGEALKAAGPNATDAGEFFGDQISTDPSPAVASAFSAPVFLLSLAAKTAGTGKDLNVSQIPDFTANIINSSPTPTVQATAAAIEAKNKAGAGAILGGAASLLATDGEKTDLAVASILDKKLASGVQEIVQWIGTTIDDTPSYAVEVANRGLNFKLSLKIATGAAAGDPTNAGNIVHNLFAQQLLSSNGSPSNPTVLPSADVQLTLNKGVSSLASTVSAVADIEEIQKIGNAIGQQIAKPLASNPAKGQIGLSKAASVVKTLATAIMNKPRTDKFGASIAANQDVNKQDEIAEVASYVLAGLVASPELNFNINNPDAKKAAAAATKAANTILSLITSAASVKPKVLVINKVKTPQGPNPDTFAADVAASVAWTVQNSSLAQSIKDALKTLLLKVDAKGNPTTAAKINKIAAAQIKAELDNVYAAVPVNPGQYENGNDPLGAVSDPETDTHPFS